MEWNNAYHGAIRHGGKILRAAANRVFNSYSRIWDLYASTERSAMNAVADTEDNGWWQQSAARDAEIVTRALGPNAAAMEMTDIGCGIGRLEGVLAKSVRHINACDISRRMVSHAEKRLAGVKNVCFHVVKKSGALPFLADGSQDAVISFYALQHMDREDALKYLVEARRVLKPGGTVIAEFPTLDHEPHRKEYLEYATKHEIYSIARMRWYTREELRLLFAMAGFEGIRLEGEGEVAVIGVKPLSGVSI